MNPWEKTAERLKEIADKNGDGKVDIKDAEALLKIGAANFKDDWFENLVIVAVCITFGFALGKFF
jgi:hypothetical protein